MNTTQKQTTDYNKVVNRPVSCIYCGASVNGRQQGQQIKWVCPRCSQLVKIGNV